MRLRKVKLWNISQNLQIPEKELRWSDHVPFFLLLVCVIRHFCLDHLCSGPSLIFTGICSDWHGQGSSWCCFSGKRWWIAWSIEIEFCTKYSCFINFWHSTRSIVLPRSFIVTEASYSFSSPLSFEPVVCVVCIFSLPCRFIPFSVLIQLMP